MTDDTTISLTWSEWLQDHASILASRPIRLVRLTDHADFDEATDLVNLVEEKIGDKFSMTEPEMLETVWPGIHFELPTP